MTKSILTLTLFLLALAAPLTAQYDPLPSPSRPHPRQTLPEAPKPIAFGGYFSLGAQANYAPHQSDLSGTLGLYAEWTRHLIQPGLDFRLSGTASAVHGVLVGPRAAATFIIFHPYVEALFGPNEIYTDDGSTVPSPVRHGITSELVLGIEEDLSPHIRWRIVEFTQGTFSGIPASNPYSLTTGFVLHL